MGSISLSCRIDAGTRKTPPMRKATRTSQNVQRQRLTTPYPKQHKEGGERSQEGEHRQFRFTARKAQELLVDFGCRRKDRNQGDPRQHEETEDKLLSAVQA